MMTEKIKPTERNKTTNGSTLKPSASSLKSFNIAALLPSAPADLALFGAWLLFSLLAFLRLVNVLTPPGGTPVED